MLPDELHDIGNPYELLRVDKNATDGDIRKAYRKRALSLHPDKNKDDKHAAHKFAKLQKALDYLKDPKSRNQLDGRLRANELMKQRQEKQTGAQKKFREELERRENEAKAAKVVERNFPQATTKSKSETEIDRLRKANIRRMQAEQKQHAAEAGRKPPEFSNPLEKKPFADYTAPKVHSNYKPADKGPESAPESFESREKSILERMLNLQQKSIPIVE
eukprot:Filipodium_phascolosomae@DN813_c0_g1_i1.p1